MGSVQLELTTERFAMAYRLMIDLGLCPSESEQNRLTYCSNLTESGVVIIAFTYGRRPPRPAGSERPSSGLICRAGTPTMT
jgi:hypothetical protein